MMTDTRHKCDSDWDRFNMNVQLVAMEIVLSIENSTCVCALQNDTIQIIYGTINIKLFQMKIACALCSTKKSPSSRELQQ